MITHVFDTSALLAHFFHEPGAEQVHALLADNSAEIGLPALALLDLKARLTSTVGDAQEAARAFHLYADELVTILPVTREIVAKAEAMLGQPDNPLSLLEAIVAATAQQEGALLVHRSRNLASLHRHHLRQIVLPLDS